MNESKYVTEETIGRTLVVGRPSGNCGKQESNRQQVRAGAMSSPMKPIRVLLAEDHMLVREGLRKMLDLETNIEVLQLIAEGKANKEIASDLCISIKTVEKHRGHLMEKLDIHDTASLTRYAISAGIIESSVQVTII
jgi:DNA-binding CsgD family transcriptional regulator